MAREKVNEFLKKYGMHYDSIDLKECISIFVKDMEAGLRGDSDATLMMLPTYLSTDAPIPRNKPIIAIDAGGTNLRIATLIFDQDMNATVENFQKYPMPGTQGTLTKDEFFDKFAEYLAPVANTSESVGWCYSYPSEILPNRDGRFIKFTKEVSVTGMEGVVLGEEFNKALAKRGIGPKRFVILNDTVAAMLGGATADPERKASSYIGFILGTGTNTCYIEQSENILKSADAIQMTGGMAINMESGGYGLFPRGKMDEIYDATTQTPGTMKYEKMVSGAYQGNVVHLIFKQAVEDGLLSSGFAEGFARLETVTMRDIDDFCDHPTGDNTLANLCKGNGEDQDFVMGVLEASYERAARMVTVNLGSIMVKTKSGSDPQRPVYITAEGTTFHKSRVFKEKLDYYVENFLNKELGVYCKFLKVEDVTLLGTAIAGLLNE